MKVKIFSMLAIAAFMTIFISGCGNKSINTVKNAVLGYDNSRTIETALNAKCKSLAWKNFKGDGGQNVVEVYGVWKDTGCKTVIENLIKIAGNNEHVQDLKQRALFPGDVIHVQFILSADGKQVKLNYGAYLDSTRKIKNAGDSDFTLSDTAHAVNMEHFLSMMYNGK